MKFLKTIRNQLGFSNLVPVIVISAVTLMFVSASSLLIINETQQGLHEANAAQNFADTDSCMETAIYKFHEDNDYTGETLTIGDTSCTITISGGPGNNPVITATSTSISSDSYSREIEVQLWKKSPDFYIQYWQENND